MSCRFVSGDEHLANDPKRRVTRSLEITFRNGRRYVVHVTKEEAFSVPVDEHPHIMSVWHYELSPEGKITLTTPARGLSVSWPDGPETVFDWPLEG
jgi:hypothetical protein